MFLFFDDPAMRSRAGPVVFCLPACLVVLAGEA